MVDADGSVTMIATPNDDSKDTAMSHTPRTPPLSAALGAFTDASQAPTDGADGAAPADSNPDGLDLSLLKKKKKKVVKLDDGEGAEGAAAPAGEEAIDLSMKKKKKKKVVKEEDEFAKKLEALNLEGAEGAEAPVDENVQEGDMDKGTGIWAHDESRIINYDPLLSRFFALLAQKNPDHASTGTRSYKIPPPQCLREGNKKTIFANLPEICKRMKRADEHVTAYLFAELGTSGSTDGSRRLVIKGRFQQKQIENVLRTYIIGMPPWMMDLSTEEMLTLCFRICDVQNLPFPQHGAVQGREPSLVCPSPSRATKDALLTLSQLHHLQLVRLSSFRPGHQDWFLGPGRKEKEDEGLRFHTLAPSSLLSLCFRFLSPRLELEGGFRCTASWGSSFLFCPFLQAFSSRWQALGHDRVTM